MRFAFLGGPACGVDVCTWNGVVFPLGVPVEVSDPRMIAKLRGNQFFAMVPAGEDVIPPRDPPRRGRPRKDRH
jgi:hypothetical protein